jgi:hypothetical protein
VFKFRKEVLEKKKLYYLNFKIISPTGQSKSLRPAGRVFMPALCCTGPSAPPSPLAHCSRPEQVGDGNDNLYSRRHLDSVVFLVGTFGYEVSI